MRKIGILLVIAGFCIIVYSLLADVYSKRVNISMIEEYENEYTTEAVSENISETITESTSENITESAAESTSVSQVSINNINVIGIMEIPSIDMKSAIGEGTDDYTLKYAVGHFEQTPMPEEGGNFCAAAHRSNTYGKFFSRLEEVEIGDKIIINRNGKKYTYSVYEKRTIETNDTSGLENSGLPQITLYTCTKNGKRRVMVKGNICDELP